MDDVSIDYEEFEPKSITIPITCITLLAVLLLLTGLWYMNQAWDFMTLGSDEYNAMKLIISFVAVILATMMIKEGDLSEGMFALITGLSIFVFSATYFLIGGVSGGTVELQIGDVIFAIPILISAIVMIAMKRILTGISALLIAIAFLLTIISGSMTTLYIPSILFVIASIILFYFVTANWIYYETDEEILPIL